MKRAVSSTFGFSFSKGSSEPTDSNFQAAESNRTGRTLESLWLWPAIHRQTLRKCPMEWTMQ